MVTDFRLAPRTPSGFFGMAASIESSKRAVLRSADLLFGGGGTSTFSGQDMYVGLITGQRCPG